VSLVLDPALLADVASTMPPVPAERQGFDRAIIDAEIFVVLLPEAGTLAPSI